MSKHHSVSTFRIMSCLFLQDGPILTRDLMCQLYSGKGVRGSRTFTSAARLLTEKGFLSRTPIHDQRNRLTYEWDTTYEQYMDFLDFFIKPKEE